MSIILIISTVTIGAIFGSFAGAQVWRLRARQLIDDSKGHEPVDHKELKRLRPLTKHGTLDDRSVCLNCKTQLHWYDMLPVISWLTLRGRCRYCHKSIGSTELWLEVGLAAVFAISAAWWPFAALGATGVWLLATWLASCVLLAILFVYDLKWFLLPSRITLLYSALAALFAGTLLLVGVVSPLSLVGAVAIMSGIYLIIYLISHGAWIGFGDIKLGLGLGLFLADWRLAFLALFLANLIGTVIVLPLMAMGKLNRHSPVPFGPFLIIGTLISVLFGAQIISWYLASSVSLML